MATLTKKKIRDTAFYATIMAIPMLMLVFTFVVINGNSIIMAFESIDYLTGKVSWAGFSNFTSVIKNLTSDSRMVTALSNSLISYSISVIVTAILPILFSYYLYKKLPMSGFFKVVLFMPSIISSIITVVIYKFLTDRILPDIALKFFNIEMKGLLSNPKTTFSTVLFYNLFVSFGGGLLIQLGAMNSVDKGVTEAASLDGLGFFGELWHVVLPKTYQIISIGFILGISSIFTSDLGLYAFYGLNADARVYTLGYFFTVETMKADASGFPYLASWGLLSTIIVLPLTFLARSLIYKLGPQED